MYFATGRYSNNSNFSLITVYFYSTINYVAWSAECCSGWPELDYCSIKYGVCRYCLKFCINSALFFCNNLCLLLCMCILFSLDMLFWLELTCRPDSLFRHMFLTCCPHLSVIFIDYFLSELIVGVTVQEKRKKGGKKGGKRAQDFMGI